MLVNCFGGGCGPKFVVEVVIVLLRDSRKSMLRWPSGDASRMSDRSWAPDPRTNARSKADQRGHGVTGCSVIHVQRAAAAEGGLILDGVDPPNVFR